VRIALLLALIGLTAAFVGEAIADGTGGTPVAPEAIQKARQFKKFRLYWLGSSAYRGDNLTFAETGNPTDFIYGDCQIPPDQTEGGCAPPYDIQNWSVCQRNMHDGLGAPRVGNFTRVKGPKRAITFRFGPGSLEVYTGRTNVVIFAPSNDLALLAARTLRPITQEHQSGTIPKPARGALRGDLSCAKSR
jgi:hypothetical protein